MIVTELPSGKIEVILDEKEKFGMYIVINNAHNEEVGDLASLIQYLIGHIVENAYLTYQEPVNRG